MKRSDFTDQQWADTPKPIQDRVLAGQSVSAINDEGGDANLWEIDPEVELHIARQQDRAFQKAQTGAKLADLKD